MLASLESLIDSTSHKSKSTYFHHPLLSAEEMKLGFRLGLDSWADTGCSGKNAYVDEFVEVKSFNVTGFTSILVSIDNLPIAHVLYAFDKENENMVFLKHNNTIYTGNDIIDTLDNPIQCEYNDMRVDLCLKSNDPNNNNTQSITFSYGTLIPVDYYIAIPCISVRKPTKY